MEKQLTHYSTSALNNLLVKQFWYCVKSLDSILASQGFLCSGHTSAVRGLDLGLEPSVCLVIWGVVALKHLSKVVWDLPLHNLVIMIVMLEYGVIALMIQVRAWDYMCLLYHTTKFWKSLSAFLCRFVAMTLCTESMPRPAHLLLSHFSAHLWAEPLSIVHYTLLIWAKKM